MGKTELSLLQTKMLKLWLSFCWFCEGRHYCRGYCHARPGVRAEGLPRHLSPLSGQCVYLTFENNVYVFAVWRTILWLPTTPTLVKARCGDLRVACWSVCDQDQMGLLCGHVPDSFPRFRIGSGHTRLKAINVRFKADRGSRVTSWSAIQEFFF